MIRIPDPRGRLKKSGRAQAAIAAVMAVSVSIGGVWYARGPSGEKVPAAVVLASQTLIRPWEGRALHAYYDRIARPPRWTICDGDTKDVRPGMIETPAGCDRRLKRRLADEFYPALMACIPHFETRPVAWQAMMLSLGWNIGTGSACGSTAARLGIAGKYFFSCEAATAFNRAGGRMVIGLVHRREMGDASRIGEGELCVSGF